MATYFSNALSDTGAATALWGAGSNPTSYNPSFKRPGYLTHARLRKKKMAYLPTTFQAGDQIVLGTFKSSDRLYDLRHTQNGTLSAGAISMGFFRSQLDHVPVATSDSMGNLLGSAFAVTAAQSRNDWMTGLGANGQYRGAAIWQLLDLGTPVLTKDPMCEYDLVMTVTTTWATVAATIGFFEADYVSFG